MLAQYENSRDSVRLPDCWYSLDNTCSPHFHNSIELTYVLSGQLSCSVSGQGFDIGAHQLVLCPSYSLHWYETHGDSNTLVLTFPSDFVPSLQNLLQTSSFACHSITLPANNPVLTCMLELERLGHLPSVNRMLLKGYLYTITGYLCDAMGMVPLRVGNSSELSREVLLYLQEHYLQPITPDSVSLHFGYSRSRFCHIFSKTFGMGFAEYLNILRCRHAAMLLESRSCSLIDAAMSSGYDNIRTFYRNFKQVFGMTPTQYISSAAV